MNKKTREKLRKLQEKLVDAIEEKIEEVDTSPPEGGDTPAPMTARLPVDQLLDRVSSIEYTLNQKASYTSRG